MEGQSIPLRAAPKAGGSAEPDMALHLAQSAKSVCLNINVQREPANDYWSAIWLKKAFCMCNWIPRPTADLRLSPVHMTISKWNEAHNNCAELDAMIIQARGMVDGPQPARVYCDIQ